MRTPDHSSTPIWAVDRADTLRRIADEHRLAKLSRRRRRVGDPS